MGFQHTVTVRFHEVDRAGIAFFGRVFEYCHKAFEELLLAGGLSMAEVFENEAWAMPLVHSHCDFERPMRMGDRLDITVDLRRVGRTSIRFDYRVVGPDGTVRATASLVHVFVTLSDFRPRAIPEGFLAALRKAGLQVAD